MLLFGSVGTWINTIGTGLIVDCQRAIANRLSTFVPRTARVVPGGMVFHVLNRGVDRMKPFYKAVDYEAFALSLIHI